MDSDALYQEDLDLRNLIHLEPSDGTSSSSPEVVTVPTPSLPPTINDDVILDHDVMTTTTPQNNYTRDPLVGGSSKQDEDAALPENVTISPTSELNLNRDSFKE
eukprot:sb/3478042/